MEKLKAISDLIRLDKQYGTLLLMMPTLWSLFLASYGKPSLKHLLIFIFGSFVMRSAGCIINDMADKDIDRFVERTRERPLASGRLSIKEAKIVLLALLIIAFILVFMLNTLSILLSFGALLLAGIYPFMKRHISLPQLFLGAAFGWGTIMAWAAVRNELALPPILFFLATLFWATFYDTIYALMDLEDDIKIGIKSTAIFFGGYTWLALALLFLVTIATLFAVGVIANLGRVYLVSLLLVSVGFIYQVLQITTRHLERQELFSLFKSHVWVGIIILAGIICDLLIRM